MKRSPLRRKSSLKRTSMRRKRGSTKYARRERDWARMAFVKTEPCALSGGAPVACNLWRGDWPPGACSAVVEAHHAGEHGLSHKAPDDTVVALCSKHHRSLTDRTGAFDGWPRGALKAWELAAVAYYQERYADYTLGLSDELY